MLKASIVIPSYNRKDSLRRCLRSIVSQSVPREFYEVIICSEKGSLVQIRNRGARLAKNDILIFIDDDVVCEKQWLFSILDVFKTYKNVGGVSGPSIITEEFRKNRDIFRYKWIKAIYDLLFIYGYKNIPGRITEAGTWTTRACDENCDYSGSVDYLEACNMSVRKEIFQKIGGFDEIYKGIGDWSEPDLAFRIRQEGYKLWFDNRVRIWHEPSRSGAFLKRDGESSIRLHNYLTFAKRWVKDHWRHRLYKLFLRGYYASKTIK